MSISSETDFDTRRISDLKAEDIIQIDAPWEAISPRSRMAVRLMRNGVQVDTFAAVAAIETNLECETLRAGGLLPLILRKARN